MTFIPRNKFEDARTHWSTDEWMAKDVAAISAAYGPLPLNHLKREAPPQTAFVAWLEKVLKPATVDYVLTNSGPYGQCYAIFRSLAEHQRVTRPVAADASA